MFHTGDIYEIRARAERHRELRRLRKTLTGFLFRSAKPEPETPALSRDLDCANDRTIGKSRVA